MENKLTYRDFKIGQIVICTKEDDFEQLEVGKGYEIVDLESKFPDAICINVRKGGYSAFFKIDNFDDISAMRNMKIDKILGE